MATTEAQYPSDGTDFGDFVHGEEEEIDLEDVVEPWHKYDIKETPHVFFYPIHVGEVLNARYLVEHKLGFDGFSTVWMAHDLVDKRDVALKVMSLGQEMGEHEIQDRIVQDVQGKSHLVTYLATVLPPRGQAYGSGVAIDEAAYLFCYTGEEVHGNSYVCC